MEEELITAEQFLKEKCAPYQKIFEPDGANLYVEENMALMMKEYAKVACEEQRRLCANEVEGDPEVEQTIIDDIISNVKDAPQPEVLKL